MGLRREAVRGLVRAALGGIAVLAGAAMLPGPTSSAQTRTEQVSPPTQLRLDMIPRQLRASPAGDGRSVHVSWLGDPAAFQIVLERESQTAPNQWTRRTRLAPPNGGMPLLQDSPGPGRHRYRFFAVENEQAGAWVGVSTSQPTIVPSVPAGVTASGVGNLRALVSWVDTSDNETGFEIERSPAFPAGSVRVAANVNNYVDSCGTGQFSYRVRALGSAGNSNYSPWANVTVEDINPVTPTNLAASDAGNERDVTITWTPGSNNAQGFRVQRETKSGAEWRWPTTLNAPPGAVTLTDTPGGGEHRYRIAAFNAVGQSAFSDWVSVTLESGWTALRRSADSRVVYVSSSTGNDANDGLTPDKPKKTIAAGYALLRHQRPDWLLLKRGDTWDTPLGWWKKSGRSASEPMVVATYGEDTARPRLNTGKEDAFLRSGGGGSPASIDFLTVVGLDFRAQRAGADEGTGVNWLGPGQDILFEDCRFEGYRMGLVVQGISGRVERFNLRRSLVLDSFTTSGHSSGIYAEGVDGFLIEENVFDHNGHKPGVAPATIFNHNTYISTANTGVIYRGNIALRGASHGVQVRCGGVISGNVFARNPVAVLLGGGDPNPITHTNGVTGSVDGNLIIEGNDISPTLPRGFGIDIMNIGSRGATVRDNIIANKTSAADSPAITLGAGGYGAGVGCMNVLVSGNIVHNWRGALWLRPPDQGLAQRGHRIENNTFSDPQSGTPSQLIDAANSNPTTATYVGNRYYSARPTNSWFDVNDTLRSYPQWVSQVNEVSSQSGPMRFVDGARTLGTYNASIGGDPTFEAFVAALRQRSSRNWPENLTAAAIIEYFRAGFAPRQ